MKFRSTFTLLFTVCCLLFTALWADESVLSKDRLDIFDLNKKQVEQNSQKLEKDWINPITYRYSNTLGGSAGTDIEYSKISVDQPIFKSGGIYQAIKYASSLKKYQNLDIDTQKKAMIKEALYLLYQIQRTKFQIAKQDLLIKNSEIDIETKTEQVLNGILDTSTLDNAILESNAKKNSLLDMEYQLQNLIISFSNLSTKSHENFELPKFELLGKDDFINNNIYLKKAKADTDVKNWLSKMSVSKYMPTLNVTYDYTKYHDTDNIASYDDNDKYGVSLMIPLDSRTFNDIESSKIEYLKSKVSLNNIQLEEENFLRTRILKLGILDKRKLIAKDDVKKYDSLLSQMTELRDAGMKTDSDVQTLKNSMEIKEFDVKIVEVDKQMELLEMYARVVK